MKPPAPSAPDFVAQLRANLRTVVLGTVSPDGEPDASVATAILGEAGSLIVYVSGLAAHTGNLAATGRASVLLVEDEVAAAQPFARRRLTLTCTATPLPRASADFAATAAAFRARFGSLIDTLVTLPDFQFVRLTPQRGRLVLGFGQAFEIDPRDWSPKGLAVR